ncbi:MAG: enoyl-CoA hydratase/isomerase family protein [Pseudomonadota bacterium]
MGDVTIERRGRVAIVSFDRGGRANALSMGLMRELTATARGFEDDHETSAVVLAGAANFSLGFDLKDPETATLGETPLAARRVALQTGGRMCRAWAEVEPITIAAVSGWCVGGGLALALSCDLRVASAEAVFYAPEVERGMNMSWGSVPRAVDLVGPARAKRLLALAEKVDAARAAEWGLVDETAEDPLAAALAYAERAASLPPVALRMIKRGVDAYAAALHGAAAHADFEQFALAQTGDDFEEGVASFLEGRPPRFTGG